MFVLKKIAVVLVTFVGFFAGSSRELLNFTNEVNKTSLIGDNSTSNGPDGEDGGGGGPTSG